MSTILVVDDTPADRQVLRALLGPRGHTVMEASDAAEALEQVHRARPDLVIVDIFMPRMSGLELVTRLRAEPDLAGIPVLFHTAWYDDSDTRRAMRAHGYAVMAKPVAVHEVVAQVESLLARGVGQSGGLRSSETG